MKNQASSKSQCINLVLCFPDDLLLEVFYRLPTFESIVRCKSVCKNWLNLITKPGFEARYIAFRINNSDPLWSENSEGGSDELLHPHVICLRRYNAQPFIYPNNRITSFTCLDSVLSFVPAYQGHLDTLAIKSWCNDLVLCTSALPKELELYICNPRTRQYIQLPPPCNRQQCCLATFTWDPYYMFDKHTAQVTLNSDSRYCVCYAVPGFIPSTRLQVEIFSSENRLWRKAELRTPHRFRYSFVDFKNCFTYKGMLHFYAHDAIVGFDPYNIDTDGVICGHFIRMPPFDPNASYTRSISIGVFGQQLLLVEYRSRHVIRAQQQLSVVEQNNSNSAYAITAWELKNYNTGEWSMKRVIYLHDLVSEESILTERIKRGIPYSRLIYIYPNDADILILMDEGHIVECNINRRTLKTVCSCTEYLPKIYGLAFQRWPTPLPSNI